MCRFRSSKTHGLLRRTTFRRSPHEAARTVGASRGRIVRLLVVYRCTPRDNSKRRPAYYSKRTCLASFVRAVEACSPRPEVVFWADGDFESSMEATMRAAGELRPAERSGIVGSY